MTVARQRSALTAQLAKAQELLDMLARRHGLRPTPRHPALVEEEAAWARMDAARVGERDDDEGGA